MASSSLSSNWIVVPKPVPRPRVRLLCFPHGGGNAQAFYAWPRDLPPDVEVCAVQLPGRGPRLLEAPLSSIDQIIGPLWEAFQPLRGTPVAFFGHSLGASIAFEFARFLQSRTISLVRLFVSGASAPHLPDREPPIRHLPDGEFIAEVRQRYEALPEEILRDDEMVQVVLPALRADFAMAETHRLVDAPLLECPLSALGGHEDGSVNVFELAAWRDTTSGAFDCRTFPGGHFFIDSARKSVLGYLAEVLNARFAGTSARAAKG